MHPTPSFVLLGAALCFLFGVGTSYTLAAYVSAVLRHLSITVPCPQYEPWKAHTVQYDVSNFFDEFSFYTGADPTYGYVDYVSQSVAANTDLIGDVYGLVYLGVDAKTYNPPGGRASVRLTSNQAFGNNFYFYIALSLKLT